MLMFNFQQLAASIGTNFSVLFYSGWYERCVLFPVTFVAAFLRISFFPQFFSNDTLPLSAGQTDTENEFIA